MAAASSSSLDDEIRQAEACLIARNARLRQQGSQVAYRVRRALPLWIGGGVLALVALNVGGRWLHRHDVSRRPTREPGQSRWAGWLALALPLLPVPAARRVGSPEGLPLLALAVSLVRQMLAPSAGQHPPLQTMTQVDLQRYAGTWFEIARLPAPFEDLCARDVSATYLPRDDGQVEVVNRCLGRDGQVRESQGVARVVPDSGNARLEVSLWPAWLRWLPRAWADYWILWLDDSYSQALVGSPDRRSLWVLSRQPTLSEARMQALLQRAVALGFAIDELSPTTHTGPALQRAPSASVSDRANAFVDTQPWPEEDLPAPRRR